MPAESDAFCLLVAAIRISAIVSFELKQREVARVDLDVAKRDWLGALKIWHRPAKFERPGFRRAALECPLQLEAVCTELRLQPVRIRNTHPFGASDRGI